MRILILSQYFWPESFLVNDLVRQLRAKGHEITVLTGMPNYPKGEFFSGYGFLRKWRDEYEGVPIIRVPLWPRGRGGAINLALNYLSFVGFASALGLARLRGKYDCTFVFAPSPITQVFPAILYKWLTRTPVVLWVQDLWPESLRAVGAVRSPSLLRKVEGMVRFLYRHCDRILVQSQAFRENVEALCGEPSKVIYIPNWAEDLYRPASLSEADEKAKLLPSGFRVMFAGNIGKAQSLDTVLEAAVQLRQYPDIQWVLLGDGRERHEFQQRVQDSGMQERVHFLGRFPAQDMPKFFALADALLVTLRADPVFDFTIPSKVQAYMACGRPIIAALNGEGRRIIEEAGAGLSGPAGDADTLAANVLRLYRSSEVERSNLATHSLSYSQNHFDRGQIINNLEKTLMNLHVEGQVV